MAETQYAGTLDGGFPSKVGPSEVSGPDGQHCVSKRLQTELMQLMMSSSPGISAFPESDANLLKWRGVIEGPDGTYYEGLKFRVSLEFPTNYPYVAPKVRFLTPMWHPNIDMSGTICLDILQNQWSAVYNVQTILLSLQSLLGEPNNASPLNAEAARLWNEPKEYMDRLQKRHRDEDDE